MGDMIAQLIALLIVVVAILTLRWMATRVPAWGDVPDEGNLERDADAALIVPVTQIWHRRILGETRNGITPRLWLTHSGLRFTVFRETERRFADFKKVDARRALKGAARLIFIGRGERVQAIIPNLAVARALLRALPAGLPLTPSALALRGQGQSRAEASPSVPAGKQRPSSRLDVEVPTPRNTLATILFALSLLCAGWMVWEWVTYAGSYRWLSDWQIRYFGTDAWFPPSAPLATVGVALFIATIFAQPGRRDMVPGAVLVGVAGLIITLVGGRALVLAFGRPSFDDPLTVIDLSRSGAAVPRSAHARLIGRSDNDDAVEVPRHGKSATAGLIYTPVRPSGAAPSPVHFVVRTSRRAGEKADRVVNDPQGLLLADHLPNEARARFELKGVTMADSVSVLEAGDESGFSDDLAASVGLLAGGLAMTMGRLALRRGGR